MSISSDAKGPPPVGRDRPLLATFVIILVVIGAAAAVFVGSYSGQRVAGLATRVQQLEGSLRSAELARLYATQAVYLSDRPDARDTLERTIDAANDARQATVADSDAYLALSQPGDDESLTGARRAFSERVGEVIALVRAGRTSRAATDGVDALDQSYERLRDVLVDRQQLEVDAINRTSSSLGHTADLVRFLLAFALPAIGITVYRWVMHRQRRNAEMQLRLESQEVINKSKDQFIANVSHELRTPLTGIVGFAQLLEESDLEPADLDVVRLIVNQSAELSCMVDDLLTAARADARSLSVQPCTTAIEDEVMEVVRFVEMMGTDVGTDLQEARVTVDPERLRQVLRNLIVNAAKHGGTRIRVQGTTQGSQYVCSVIDDGPGIPAHVEERLFSRFVHAGREPLTRGSVGLGLAIVGEVSRLMGCEVTYRRVHGETWFSVTVPLAEAATADEHASVPVGTPSR